MIRASDVTKTYGLKRGPRTVVLDGVSVDLAPSQLISIVGANGAGKSTLLAIVSRLIEADRGSVFVDELNVATAPSAEVARRLAVLRQDTSMTSRLTVRELVAFGRFPHSQGRLTRECERAVDSAIDYFELGDLQHRYLDQISGGQRQRAFVAMVLAQDAKYVLLDEPLNNLDMRHSVQMMRLLRSMADETGKTVVLVVHDINFAAAHSDRIVAMRHGRVVADGDVATMMSPAVLGEVFDMDIDVHDLGGQRVATYFR